MCFQYSVPLRSHFEASSLNSEKSRTTSKVFYMSTNGDNLFPGTPDVVEQQSSTSYSGRSRGGRHNSSSRGNRIDPSNSSNSSHRERGRYGGRTGNQTRSGQKDPSNEQVIYIFKFSSKLLFVANYFDENTFCTT